MNKKLLLLDSLTFDSPIQVGTHRYAKFFKEKNYEVFILSQFINIYRFLRRKTEDKELIRSWRKGIQISREGIYYYTPFCYLPYLNLPILDTKHLARNSLKFCCPSLKKILANKKFIEIDILFINNVRLFSILKLVRPRLIIFRISDRIEAFKNMPKTVLSVQKEAIKTSDLVFVSSKNLLVETQKINKNAFYLPNGVDENFIMSEHEIHSNPQDYKIIKKPIVLYVGAISDWFDYELYEYGIKKLENVNFVAIGPVSGVNYKENLNHIHRCLNTYKNFYYLGPKMHSELKNYLLHANIGIIPFKVNSLTNEINPVKLFEYAGYGLPIITSSLSDLQNYSDHVLCYKDKDEYIHLISDYLDKKKYLSEKLIGFARRNTWEKRSEFILAQIEKTMNKNIKK